MRKRLQCGGYRGALALRLVSRWQKVSAGKSTLADAVAIGYLSLIRIASQGG
jgi:hypothetical protein